MQNRDSKPLVWAFFFAMPTCVVVLLLTGSLVVGLWNQLTDSVSAIQFGGTGGMTQFELPFLFISAADLIVASIVWSSRYRSSSSVFLAGIAVFFAAVAGNVVAIIGLCYAGCACAHGASNIFHH